MAIALVLITLIIADAVKFIAEKIYEYNKLIVSENKYKEWMKND